MDGGLPNFFSGYVGTRRYGGANFFMACFIFQRLSFNCAIRKESARPQRFTKLPGFLVVISTGAAGGEGARRIFQFLARCCSGGASMS